MKNMASSSLVLIKLVYLIIHFLSPAVAHQSSSPTAISREGLVSLPFNTSVYHVQSPYNLPQSKRYRFENGVHKCWVYTNDLPLSRTSQTGPRTELAIQGYRYSSGVWEFEGYGYVKNSGPAWGCIMQVFGSRPGTATSLMLMAIDGNLHHYSKGPVLLRNMYNKWFKLNVIDDFDSGKINVYINDKLVMETRGRGGKDHYFKCGIYAHRRNDSLRIEAHWKNIRILRKA